VVLDAGLYAEVPTSVLADSLEAQHDRGEALNSEMVFEVVDRLVVAEGLAMPSPDRPRKTSDGGRLTSDSPLSSSPPHRRRCDDLSYPPSGRVEG
jgi:hypothetical protein